jgi:hypothetical protein
VITVFLSLAGFSKDFQGDLLFPKDPVESDKWISVEME